MEYLVNEDFDFSIVSILGGVIPNKNGVVFTKTMTEKLKINSKKVLHTSLSWTVSGCPKGVVSAHGSGYIASTSTKITCEGGYPLCHNDVGVCNGTYFFYVTFPCACNYTITDAGQDKMAGN